MISDLLQNRLRILSELDSTTLTEIVRRAQDNPNIEIGSWTVSQLSSEGGINPEGLFLFSGDSSDEYGQRSWTVVLKMIQSYTPEPDPSNAWHWKREYWVMETGMLNTLPGPLASPNCYGVELKPDGAWIWLEHIHDQSPRRWGLNEFVFAADQLGRTTGAWLSSRMKLDYPWLSRGIAQTWSEGFGPSEERWANEYIRQDWSSSMKERLMAVWSERARLYAAMERLPQTFAHFDSQRRNLMIRSRPDGKDELVAVDWAWCGIGPVGADAAILIGNSMILGDADPKVAAQLDDAVFQSYIAGLRTTGWNGNTDEVRLAYTAANTLFCGVTMPGMMLSFLNNSELVRWIKENYGMDTSDIAEHYMQMGEFGIECGEEALRLIDRNLQ